MRKPQVYLFGKRPIHPLIRLIAAVSLKGLAVLSISTNQYKTLDDIKHETIKVLHKFKQKQYMIILFR